MTRGRCDRGALEDVLTRIVSGLRVAEGILANYSPGRVEARHKGGGDPVTEADLALDAALRAELVRDDEGWLSEETADSPDRLGRGRLWVVDPIDGTKEFVEGLPEWCVSIGYVVDGEALAGAIYNRGAGHTIIGSVATGVELNGTPVRVTDADRLAGATVLASRSEVRRGEWARHADAPFTWRPMGSVAYKLGLVAAGLADATWTLVPKSEWDVAAGAALVRAAGGAVKTRSWESPRFNRPSTKLEGLVAGAPGLVREIGIYLGLIEAP